MARYEVIVGGICTVYSGDNVTEARYAFKDHVKQSKNQPESWSFGKDVMLFDNDLVATHGVMRDHFGHLRDDDDDTT